VILFYPGEKLTIQYKDKKSGFEADEVPNEAMDRICECVTRDDNTITVRFPYPVKMRDGTMTDTLTIPIRHKLYTLQREELVSNAEYERGPSGDTFMLPVENLYNSYWGRVWSKRVSDFLLNGPAMKRLEHAIRDEGLRAPIIAHRDSTLRGGSHRIMMCKRLGWDKVETYITKTMNGTL
jgi:hypothetical protein